MPRTIHKAPNRFYRVDRLRPPGSFSRASLKQNHYQRPNSRRRPLLVTLSIIGLVLLVQSLFQLPWLQLRQIEIQGLTYVPVTVVEAAVRQELDSKKLWFFKNSSYFLFSDEQLQERLANEFYLTDLKLTKYFPGRLLIQAKEKILPFVRQTPGGYYQLDYKGEVAGPIDTPKEQDVIIADEREDLNQNIPLTYLEQATKLVLAWSTINNLPRLDRFHLTDDQEQLIVSTEQGYRVLFKIEESYQKALTSYQEILSQNLLPDQLEYVDLRFENNVYFK